MFNFFVFVDGCYVKSREESINYMHRIHVTQNYGKVHVSTDLYISVEGNTRN